MRILLVEDNGPDGVLLKAMLMKLGYQDIHEAPDGIEATRKIRTAEAANYRYDLVLTDWKMPGMSGLELLKRLRGHHKTSRTPVILLTGLAEQQQVHAAIKEGTTDYIVKPVTLDVLKSKIEKIFKK